MSVELIWKHQQETYEKMLEQLSKTKKAGYIYPTSCGKSFPVLKYLESNQDKRVLFLAPSIEIIEQFKEYVQKYIMVSNRSVKSQFKNWHFITYQSLKKFNTKNVNVDIIVSDELHRTGGEVWGKEFDTLLENNPNADKIGITATPKRTDGKNMMDKYFENDIIYEFSKIDALSGDKTKEVILKPTRYVRVISRLKPVLKEYREKIEQIKDDKKREKLLSRFEKIKSTIEVADKLENTFEEAMKNKKGKYIVFCSDEKDMQEAMKKAHQWFDKVNPNIWIGYVYSGHQGSEMRKSPKLNRWIMNEFKRTSPENEDKLKLLFCVNKLNEGVHIDGISGIIMLRPTISPVLYEQQIGRGFITADKESEETVIIDGANNWLRFYDTYKEIEKSVKRGKTRRTIEQTEKEKNLYESFDFIAEEIELIELLREMDFSIKGTKFLENAKGIKKWIEDSGDTKPPVETSKDLEEAYWGIKLRSIRGKYLKPYYDLETEEEREEYKSKRPQFEEVKQIIEEIDRNNIAINLRNARNIKKWIENSGDKKKPSSISKDDEERKLGNSFKGIYRLIRKYIELQTEEEKEEFKKMHPELEELMKIMEEIEIITSIKLKYMRQIEKWIEESGDTKAPSKYSEDETEAYWGEKFSVIKYDLINPYLELKTEKERELYKQKNPELDEIMKIVYDINSRSKDKRNRDFAEKIKNVMKRTVFENVSTNRQTRQELHELEREFMNKGANRHD